MSFKASKLFGGGETRPGEIDCLTNENICISGTLNLDGMKGFVEQSNSYRR